MLLFIKIVAVFLGLIFAFCGIGVFFIDVMPKFASTGTSFFQVLIFLASLVPVAFFMWAAFQFLKFGFQQERRRDDTFDEQFLDKNL